jgi:hypothetical protein
VRAALLTRTTGSTGNKKGVTMLILNNFSVEYTVMFYI